MAEGSRVVREYPITLGRIEGHGRRGKALYADYVLEYRTHKLAVVEATGRAPRRARPGRTSRLGVAIRSDPRGTPERAAECDTECTDAADFCVLCDDFKGTGIHVHRTNGFPLSRE